MVGFLRRLAIAGARPVPSRVGLNLRRAGGKVASAEPGEGAPYRVRDRHLEPHATEQGAPQSSALQAGTGAAARAAVPPENHEPAPPIAERPSVAAARPQLEPTIAPRASEPERRTPSPPVPASDPKSTDPVLETMPNDILPPVPFLRVPALSGEALGTAQGRADNLEVAPLANGSVPGFAGPPMLEREAAVRPPAAPRLDSAPIPRSKQVPLPTLDVPDRAPSRSLRPETPPERPEPEAAVKPMPRERNASRQLTSPVVQPALNPVPPPAQLRPPSPQPAGLTIHKFELQIVERPRDVAEPANPAAVGAAENLKWGWPDRRYVSRVW